MNAFTCQIVIFYINTIIMDLRSIKVAAKVVANMLRYVDPMWSL